MLQGFNSRSEEEEESVNFKKSSTEITQFEGKKKKFFKKRTGTSLVVQQLRICLAMEGTWVQPLVRETEIPHAARQPSPCTLESVQCNWEAARHRGKACVMQPRPDATE